MFESISLRAKLLISFFTVLAFLIITSVISNYGMTVVQERYQYITTDIMGNMQTVYEMDKAFQEANRNLLRIYIVDSEDDVLRNVESFYKNFGVFKEYDENYRKIPFVEGEQAMYDAMIENYRAYLAVAEIFLNKVKSNPLDKESHKAILAKDVREARHKFNEANMNLIKFHRGRAEITSTEAMSVYKQTFYTVVGVCIFAIIVSVIIALFFSNFLSNKMLSFSKEIESTSFVTSEASTQLAQYSSLLSQGSNESAASLEETVASLEELSSMVKRNSDHAKEANDLSQNSLNTAEIGEREIAELITVMTKISKSSQKIEEITNVIDDIAFQTNLLALNAAVEAARAGEHGKGFAIVAEAVRNLAIRSAAAAKDINSLIDENVTMSESGEKVAEHSGGALKGILDSVKKVANLNSEISAASVEQAHGIDQISKAMNHLDQAIQTNASSAEQVDHSAGNMKTQAEVLQNVVDKLQIFVNGKKSLQVHYKQEKQLNSQVS